MNIKTLIIGFVPLSETTGKKPREIRDDSYFKELLSKFDLGEVHYATYKNWKEVVVEVDPLLIITFNDYFAGHEIQEYKNDALLYVTYDAGQIFYRKAEIEKKKAEQIKTFTEIEGLIQKIRDDGEDKVQYARKFASMSYDDMYQMLMHAIAGDNEDLRKNAWELLTSNNGHKNFIWMRAQMVCEAWNHSDGKGKEEFLCMAMDQHIDEGMARKLEDFMDEDGQKFHQYLFCDYFGRDLNYIRRIPFGEKGQDKWGYQSLLDKYETPNGPQMMLEAGHTKKAKDDYFKGEAEKITRVLTSWKEDPTRSKKELMVVPWDSNDSENDPLTERELTSMWNFLKKHDPVSFDAIFVAENETVQ